MNQNQSFQVLELTNGVIRRHGSLSTLFTDDTNTDVGCLDHSDIVSTVADGQSHHLRRNLIFRDWDSSAKISANVNPSTMIAVLEVGNEWSFCATIKSSASPFKLNLDKYSVKVPSMFSLPCFKTSNSISFPNKLQEKPMLIAVSILSPVRIQSLIPALPNFSMDSGTPTCKRSSMAVPP
ncbi:hypothetical protein WICPIJ_000881 [Wickerhamomyces pijperi]|uniref:Uncharacterized protein n=1 Tax=Wickerhamomyces pijperi TaxID=599730 RepID=A0A9P8QEP6_WICPI|nr:hypothetical protein WICPIJ_000881 [Wickerhamomyces pijperi]